ncbi:MAG: hypothetical protein KAH23_01650, partial [Kiritimatiellae bacterium]|nr:hypothetical protein [Kiritimatiellia bacterium]
MTEFQGWTQILSTNAPIVLVLFGIGFGGLVFLSNKLFENTNRALVNEIKALVKRIDDLFSKHDTHEDRISHLETSVNSHLVQCTEREKMLVDIKKTQKFHITKFNDALI